MVINYFYWNTFTWIYIYGCIVTNYNLLSRQFTGLSEMIGSFFMGGKMKKIKKLWINFWGHRYRVFEEDNKVCDVLIYHRKIYIIKE